MKPIFFERNRVGRVYTGGKLFSDFFGDEPIDGYKPEEWIASNVNAINEGSSIPKEGISKIKNSDLYFDELIEKDKDILFGKNDYRILVKGLDSAIRLPAQAHPDKAFSEKHFNSTHGKTECWLILDTRPDAKLYFGFRDGVTREDFENAIDMSETEPDAMEKLMKTVYPKKGEVYFVPARTVHAIGAGCLILEVQEPTDFTIQPEHFCGEYKLSDNEMYLGLDRKTAMECFDFNSSPEPLIIPQIKFEDENIKFESLINDKQTDCFVINRITLNNGEFSLSLKDSYGVYIITEGCGELIGKNYKKTIKKGDYFFISDLDMGEYKIKGNIEIIECY